MNPAEVAIARGRESEPFSLAADQAPIGMCLVGLDGRLLRVNAAACKLWERTEDELVQCTFQQLTHPEDLSLDLALLEETLAGYRAGYEMSKRYLTPAGRVIPARLCVSLVRNSAGDPSYFISQIVDLTDIHAAHSQIRMLQERERIAAQLHDHTIQRLFSLGLMLASFGFEEQVAVPGDLLAGVVEELDATITELRGIMHAVQSA